VPVFDTRSALCVILWCMLVVKAILNLLFYEGEQIRWKAHQFMPRSLAFLALSLSRALFGRQTKARKLLPLSFLFSRAPRFE